MKIMIGLGHPKQVHIWKNIINNLRNHGHNVKILVWDKDMTCYLLNKFGLEYEVVGKNYKGIAKKAFGLIESNYNVLRSAKKFNPDIFIAGIPCLAHVSKIFRKPHISFLDTENANITYWLTYPFTDVFCTPSCFKGKINPKKHITFNGLFELAYLHPNYFGPDPTVLDEIGLDKNDKIILIRFVGWGASHDIGDYGLTDKMKLVKTLEKFGRIFITSEIELPFLKKYRINIPPEKIHHFLYYADLFIGESAPMSTESAILGTPAIFVSTSRRGYTDELESKYDMLYTFSNPNNAQEEAVEKAIELLEYRDTKKEWQQKRQKLLSEMIDVTKFMTELIERFEINNR